MKAQSTNRFSHYTETWPAGHFLNDSAHTLPAPSAGRSSGFFSSLSSHCTHIHTHTHELVFSRPGPASLTGVREHLSLGSFQTIPHNPMVHLCTKLFLVLTGLIASNFHALIIGTRSGLWFEKAGLFCLACLLAGFSLPFCFVLFCCRWSPTSSLSSRSPCINR